LFALGRSRGAAVAFPVGSSLLGAAFHRIVEKFAKSVAAPPRELLALQSGAARDDVESAIAHWLLALLVEELDADDGYASMPAEVDDLAEALRELARHLTGRLQHVEGAPSAALPRVVMAGEQAVEACLESGGPVLRGRIDAMYGDARGEPEVIEYKLTDEANDAVDRAQVALYRALLRHTAGVDARPVVLRFTPTLRETALDPSSADALVHDTLLPLVRQMATWAAHPETAPPTSRLDLCPACPLARECVETYRDRVPVRDDPPAGSLRSGEEPNPDAVLLPPEDGAPTDEEGLAEARRIRDRILAELKKEGIAAASPPDPIVGPTLYVVEVSRPRGRVAHLDRAADDVMHRLAIEPGVEASYEKQAGHRRFTIRRPCPRKVLLLSLLAQERVWLCEKPGRYVLGQQPNGTVLRGDFSDAGTPHLLVGGQAGSGKSTFLLSLVASLAHAHGPEAIRFTLVDPKRVTFTEPFFVAAVGAHLDGPIGYELDSVNPTLERLVDVMEERYEAFQKANVQNLDDYNAQVGRDGWLERKVLVIDEFQDLMTDKGDAKAFAELVQRLGAKSRAAGIHMVLSTQRPDRQTILPGIKANLGGKVALKVASGINSRIILDANGAEKLHGKGDLLADLGHGLVRAQGALMAHRHVPHPSAHDPSTTRVATRSDSGPFF
jgi:S-DNA-T family DNA segregation ATPase FtsK/SpoIIIE